MKTSSLIQELRGRLPQEKYLADWFEKRQSLVPWPDLDESRWISRTIRSVERWLKKEPTDLTPLDRQDGFLFDHWNEIAPETILNFLNQTYPESIKKWAFYLKEPQDNQRLHAMRDLWKTHRQKRRSFEHERKLATDLPEFHGTLIGRLRKLLEAETALESLLNKRDIGWDLETGDWENLDFGPLFETAERLSKEKELQKIAELLGRDYRARSRPPEPPPPNPFDDQEPEPGRSEIRGVTFGRSWSEALSSEAALLAFPNTETVFFKKEAEGELLVWDYFSQAAELQKDNRQTLTRQAKNERGPIVIALDTSGSMRGKPEEIAKALVFALTRIALEENRACYLINFSSTIKTLDLSDLANNLSNLVRFLQFSFHGGTDLGPALNEALSVLQTGNFREADVLVLSDFAVPKIPTPLRTRVRYHQQIRGTRFYAVTVSVRPMNDFLNIFDASWVYNIHPYQTNGIDPATLWAL